MSAASFAVVSPRKGKHTRSQGLTLSSSHHEGTARAGASTSALPANVDILTLDPDDAFVRFSVRDVQAIEASLQTTHDALSSNLRSLVSEKYRDMLGTANTLIDMSSSATNLVNRLDAVREGVEKARAQRDGTTSREAADGHHDNITATNVEQRTGSDLFSIAASTKLLAEAPDEVWRAVDSASLDSTTTTSARSALQGRELTNHKAATALRAAWIYDLCQEAWKWLSEEKQTIDSDTDVDIQTLFPYISKQWHALETMKVSIIEVSHAGLEGWFASDLKSKKRWEDVSSSYITTVTFLLSAASLESLSTTSTRGLLLKQRQKAISKRLQLGKRSPSRTLTRLVRIMAETMISCIRAFVILEDDSTLPHLASIFKSVGDHSNRNERSNFPLGAQAALSTLPSATIFVEHLPASVRQYTPRLDHTDAEECSKTTVKVLQDWSTSIRTGQELMLTRLVDGLSTISSVGEAQIQLRETLDRCCNMVAKMDSEKESEMRSVVETELKALVVLLEGLLLRRLDVLCQERTAELPAAVSNSISSALSLLSASQFQTARSELHNVSLERVPTRFLFDSEHTSSSLESRLRMQTPLVQRVLLSVEQHAQSLGEEMEDYAAYVQRDARKRAKRKHKSKQPTLNGSLTNGHNGQMNRVLHLYRTAFDSARIALTDELGKRLDHILQSNAMEDKRHQLLYIIRIASAFQHSTVLRSSKSMSAEGSNDLFLQRLGVLRTNVIRRWVDEIVKCAILSYTTKVRQCLDPRSDQLGRPTSTFIECLMQLVDGIQAVGCGYQSELSALGQDVLSTFASSWLDLDAEIKSEQDRQYYTFDSYALSVILADDPRSQQATTKLKKIASGLEDRTKEQIETALQRFRLILVPLSPLYSSSQSQKKSTVDGITSAPPLPMLTIIQGKERVALL